MAEELNIPVKLDWRPPRSWFKTTDLNSTKLRVLSFLAMVLAAYAIGSLKGRVMGLHSEAQDSILDAVLTGCAWGSVMAVGIAQGRNRALQSFLAAVLIGGASLLGYWITR